MSWLRSLQVGQEQVANWSTLKMFGHCAIFTCRPWFVEETCFLRSPLPASSSSSPWTKASSTVRLVRSRRTPTATTRCTTTSSRSTPAATRTPRRWASLRRELASLRASIPTILKLNNSDSLLEERRSRSPPSPARCNDALRLGCAAIGFTIYPGLGLPQRHVHGAARARPKRPRKPVWPSWCGAYPRGSRASRRPRAKLPSTSSAYAAQIAAQLGAHVIKVKPPTGLHRAGRREARSTSRKASRSTRCRIASAT